MSKLDSVRAAVRGRPLDPAVMALGNGPTLEVRAEPAGLPTGHDYPAGVRITLGSTCMHVARMAVVNGHPAAIIGAQSAGWAAGVCRRQAAREKIHLMLQERQGTGPAISVIVPNGRPGHKDIYTQRVKPPTAGELTPEMRDALGLARVVFVGPLPWGPDTGDLLFQVPALAPQAFRALLPHPSLLGEQSFALLARRYHYLQINAHESRLLDGAVRDLVLNARRLSFLCGEENACAVTHGGERGWLWAEGRWRAIEPRPVGVVDETGCGDAFAAAFLIGWRLLGLGVDGALRYAVKVAAATALQVGLTRPLPYRKVPVLT